MVDKTLVEVAERVFGRGLKPAEVPPTGYVYRDGKAWKDCVAAIRKGMWDGAGKFEHEMECVARELAKVFKQAGEQT